jgi:hypothetical protein
VKEIPPSNAEVAEMLARRAGESAGILVRAFKRAARSAFLWPERAAIWRRQGDLSPNCTVSDHSSPGRCWNGSRIRRGHA